MIPSEPRPENFLHSNSHISYGSHPLQKLKVFYHLPENDHTLLLIHGGAWNDPANTYDDFKELAGHLMASIKGHVNVVGVNYRLTPEVIHPFHLYDVVLGIQKLVESLGTSKLLVAGHSVGATMLLQLLNYKQIIISGFEELKDVKFDKNGELITGLNDANFEDLLKLPELDISLEHLFFIDGIYDVVDLVAEYGGPYERFVDRAFVSRKQYKEAVQISSKEFTGFDLDFKRVVVLQSLQDELLSLRQTEGFLAFLGKNKVEYEYFKEPWGAHEEVYRRKELASIISARLVDYSKR